MVVDNIDGSALRNTPAVPMYSNHIVHTSASTLDPFLMTYERAVVFQNNDPYLNGDKSKLCVRKALESH